MTDYAYIKGRLAPCGLHCGKCFAFKDGDIKRQSEELKSSLGNFDVYASRFVTLLEEPLFADYPQFKSFLNHLTTAKCGGCRKEKCVLLKSCKVRDCHLEKGVDFCFECDSFPCSNTGFDEHLEKRSVDINYRMKEIGVETYYNEIKDKPRY